MQFGTEVLDSILILTPPAIDLDASNAEEFKRSITPLVDGHSVVVLNLESISFMDSAGLGAVLSLYKKVRADGGEFRVYGMTKEVKALFDLVRMQRLFEICDNRMTALRAPNSPD